MLWSVFCCELLKRILDWIHFWKLLDCLCSVEFLGLFSLTFGNHEEMNFNLSSIYLLIRKKILLCALVGSTLTFLLRSFSLVFKPNQHSAHSFCFNRDSNKLARILLLEGMDLAEQPNCHDVTYLTPSELKLSWEWELFLQRATF